MSMKEMQKQVDEWANQLKIPYWHPLSIMARVTEEAGELARELNDRHGGRVKKPTDDTKDIGEESADIIFALMCLANSQGINMDEAWQKVMDKCWNRDKHRFEKKENL